MPNSSVPSTEFVAWFRSVAPYINAFRGRTFVVAFGGEVVSDGKFVDLTHDFNLLSSLGVRLVLVHGARPQIERHLLRNNLNGQYHHGIRLTDSETMQCVKEAVGRVRVEIEALLSMGLVNSPMANADIRVAGGNFVTAQPMGVIDGVDLLYTGSVRKVDVVAIKDRLIHNEVVLLSPLGYSPTGEVFNLTLEEVATQTAIALDADKLIFLMETEGVQDIQGNLLRELTVADAKTILAEKRKLPEDVSLFLPCAVIACEAGVARTHLISRHADGSILQERRLRAGGASGWRTSWPRSTRSGSTTSAASRRTGKFPPANRTPSPAVAPRPGPAAFRGDCSAALGPLPIIAEDLGLITPEVTALREACGFPGMRILQFAFGSDAGNPYLPHNLRARTVAYTGTHDNETTVGWWRQRAGRREGGGARLPRPCSRHRAALDPDPRASQSVANTVVVPFQDVLGLDTRHRMNTPGMATGCWEWRFEWSQVNHEPALRLAAMTRAHGRWPLMNPTTNLARALPNHQEQPWTSTPPSTWPSAPSAWCSPAGAARA